MIQLVNLPPSAHPVHTAANLQCTLQHTATLCSLQPTIQCTSSTHTAAVITSSVHTAAILSSAHCSYIIQCTLQQISSAHCSISSVHTAAILSSAHCSYIIWCQYHTVHITSSAPMDHQKYVTAQYVTGG